MSNPRSANGHRRRQVRKRVLAEETDCWLCGQPVDKTLKTPDPMSAEVDEIIPVSLGGDPIARANCRLAHRPASATSAAATARGSLGHPTPSPHPAPGDPGGDPSSKICGDLSAQGRCTHRESGGAQ